MNPVTAQLRLWHCKHKEHFGLTLQEEEFEPRRLPQRKSTKNKQGSTASKPSRTLFEESTSSEAAPQGTSDLPPSPSQIDPEFLAALPDDVRQEIEQAYKRKDPHVARVRVQAPTTGASNIPVFPPERSVEASITVQSSDVTRREATKVLAPPKQVLGDWEQHCTA